MPRVIVVLATFNGAAFLHEQLASLAVQERLPDALLIADDGSTDGTQALVRDWAAGAPFPVEILPATEIRRGPAGNFSRLLEAAQMTSPDWVLPCDQDDVWHPTKIARCLAAVSGVDAGGPRLVVHDLVVSDRDLRQTAASFWHHQAFSPIHGSRFTTLLLMNSFPGCAMMASRGLLRIALPIPPEAVMHDWWLAAVAAATGVIDIIAEPLGFYRQHGRNTVGVHPPGFWSRVRAKLFADPVRPQAAICQARALRRVVGGRVSGVSHRALSLVAGFFRLGSGRRLALLRAGVRKTGFLRAIHALMNLR